jgi:hypothetical protein
VRLFQEQLLELCVHLDLQQILVELLLSQVQQVDLETEQSLLAVTLVEMSNYQLSVSRLKEEIKLLVKTG